MKNYCLLGFSELKNVTKFIFLFIFFPFVIPFF